jgi:hypothetical protein
MRKETDWRAGQLVEVKGPRAILETLDADGTMDGLPFMPEMLEYCGRRFRVLRYVEKTCRDLGGGLYWLHAFYKKDILLLDTLRCSGTAHDGCQRLCALFWKTAWLRTVNDSQPSTPVDESDLQALRVRLKTTAAPGRYFCQSTELARVTSPEWITRRDTMSQILRDLRSGAIGYLEMVGLIIGPQIRKIRNRVFGPRQLVGTLERTPVGRLGLQPGELVQAKSLEEIRATLDRRGRNRGMVCGLSKDYCGRKYRVQGRLDRMISESTGEMRKVEGTVFLDGSLCPCKDATGGCPRLDFYYWREVWLTRVEDGRG